ncbi:hypothetical protein SUGI_0387250 [Cryptomeria japonica]|nr:hypothetical protein SUGI_0387250 [Cryptomeria japonica]
MIRPSHTQDEEVGDGTTSIIVLAGEILHVAEAFIEKALHPIVICRAYIKTLEDVIVVLDKIVIPIDMNDRQTLLKMKYIKVEKVPRDQLEDPNVLKGVMFNKDVFAPGKMRSKILNPGIILLDCPLEYKKGENQTNAELIKKEDRDNNRIAKAYGATVVNRPKELQESDGGTRVGLFEVQKQIGNEYFSFIVDCKDSKSCTILLRGAGKDLLNEVERNLQDTICVAQNKIKNPKLVPGGGTTELTVSATLKQNSSSVEDVEKWPYEAMTQTFKEIPRNLTQNYGVNVVRTMTVLQAKHVNGENVWIWIDGNTRETTDMKERGIWECG